MRYPIQLLRRRDDDPRADDVLHPRFELGIDERLASFGIPRDVADPSRDLLRRLRRQQVRAGNIAEDPESLGKGRASGRGLAIGA